MDKKVVVIYLSALTILACVSFGCQGKVEQKAESPFMEGPTALTPKEEAEETLEPAQLEEIEVIPPTPAPQTTTGPSTAPLVEKSREEKIQEALKAAGFDPGPIDGKVGPKTIKAIKEFQQAKGLKVDGKVGSKTWAELEKYLK